MVEMVIKDDSFGIEGWKSILDTFSECMLFVDSEGYILYINRYAQNVLAISFPFLEKRHFCKVLYPNAPSNGYWLETALARKELIRGHQLGIEKNDGSIVAFYADFTPVKSKDTSIAGALIVLYPGEKADLGFEKQPFKSGVPGFLIVDNNMRIVCFNRTAESITAWKEKDVLGKFCMQILTTIECASTHHLSYLRSQNRPILSFQTELLCDAYGKKFPLDVNTAVIYDAARDPIGRIFTFSEPTKQPLTGKVTNFHGLVGKNPRMLAIYNLIGEVADSKSTVLITGESGTGKELVANAIQALSSRKDKSYIRVNCAAIPESLIESELFGHVKGAFTSAYADHQGIFEMADSGTIFLDEIGDLTLMAQLRLLRILEQGEFMKLGSSQLQKVDVRNVVATHRDLEQMIKDGTFREDLYYRLSVIPINLPPLRAKIDDISYLIEHFMAKYQRITHKNISYISDEAYQILLSHDYPGNVRELENIIECAFACTKGAVIDPTKLPPYLRESEPGTPHSQQLSEGETANERSRLWQTLAQCQWNRELAAKKLGISRSTLWRRMRALNMIGPEVK